MVTVKNLISVLKEMPQNLDVGIAMHDNNENEVAGWVSSVDEIIEEEVSESNEDDYEKRCVVLRC